MTDATQLTDRYIAAWNATDPEDRRGAYAVLKDAGAACRKKMWPTYQQAIRILFDAHLSAEEQRIMGTALRRVLDAARA